MCPCSRSNMEHGLARLGSSTSPTRVLPVNSCPLLRSPRRPWVAGVDACETWVCVLLVPPTTTQWDKVMLCLLCTAVTPQHVARCICPVCCRPHGSAITRQSGCVVGLLCAVCARKVWVSMAGREASTADQGGAVRHQASIWCWTGCRSQRAWL